MNFEDHNLKSWYAINHIQFVIISKTYQVSQEQISNQILEKQTV